MRAVAALSVVALALASCAEGELAVDGISLGDAAPDGALPPLDVPPDLGFDSAPRPQDAPSVDAPSTDASRDAGADGGMDSGLPPDAGPMFDSLPRDSVMFFTTRACPNGWEPFAAAAGRTIVPTMADAPGGTARGEPLTDGEDRAHTHRLTATFTLPEVSYVGSTGGLNTGLGPRGDVTLEAEARAASSGLPYQQLLVCRKVREAVAYRLPLPSGMMIFYAGARCPTGFTQPAGPQGRLTVGLPSGAVNGAFWGGPPLGATSTAPHSHETSLTLDPGTHGIALLSGCCGSGYAGAGTRTATRPTTESETGFPTIQLLQCQRD